MTTRRDCFGSDDTILGRQVTLDDDTYTVIGVMPKTFENVLDPAAELWSPLQYDMSQGRAWGHHLRMGLREGAAIPYDLTIAVARRSRLLS